MEPCLGAVLHQPLESLAGTSTQKLLGQEVQFILLCHLLTLGLLVHQDLVDQRVIEFLAV